MIGNLAVNLTMNTAAFQAGATIAEKRASGMKAKFVGMSNSLKTFGIGFAGGVAAGIIPAITGMAKGAFDMASSMSEAAEKVGLPVEALQELRFAADQSGVSNEQLDAALIKLTKSMGDLQMGKTAAVNAFAAIGLSADELKGKSPDQALRLIADALNKLPDPAQRVAIGSQIMGRGFAQLLPLINGGTAALDKHAEASRRNGQISTEDARKLDELADTWGRTKTKIMVAVAGIIAEVARSTTNADNWIKSFWRARDEIAGAVVNMASRVVTSISNMVTGIGQAIGGRLAAIWEGGKAKIQSFADKAKWMWDVVVRNSYIPDMVTQIGQWMGPKLQELMVSPAVQAIGTTAQAFQEGAGEMADGAKRSTKEIIEGFGQMAASTIGSVKSMVDTFKSGDILGGIQQFLQLVLSVVQALGQMGVIKLPGVGAPTPRAHGGPVSPGRNYLVGEKGPEIVSFGRRGFVHPNNDNSAAPRIQIVPSPYFNVVVDSRVRSGAAPMVGHGMVMAVAGSEQRMARRGRRAIP